MSCFTPAGYLPGVQRVSPNSRLPGTLSPVSVGHLLDQRFLRSVLVVEPGWLEAALDCGGRGGRAADKQRAHAGELRGTGGPAAARR